MLSRCCRKEIEVVHDYYACGHCSRPCETIMEVSSNDEPEHGMEIKEVSC